jgi:hypothetical protein
LLLARSFFARNPAQARLEYRLACEQDSQICQVEECLPLVRGYDDAIQLVPSGARRAAILARLTTALAPRLPSTVVRLDRELHESDPATTIPLVHAVAATLSDVRNEEAWCADHMRAPCLDEALETVREIEARSPMSCEGYALEAQARIEKREIDAAFAQLEIAADRVEDRAACNREVLALARAVGPRARIDAALDRLLKGGCSSSPECVENLVFAASVELDRGGGRRGIALLWKAWERAPEREDLLVTIATRGPAEHAHGDALEAYTKLAAKHPEDPAWREGISRERAIIARDAVMPRLP